MKGYYEASLLYRFGVRTDPFIPFMKQVRESPKISMFKEYTNVVQEYSRRQLSFESDIFLALLQDFYVP